jgi:hypothetical protein
MLIIDISLFVSHIILVAQLGAIRQGNNSSFKDAKIFALPVMV